MADSKINIIGILGIIGAILMILAVFLNWVDISYSSSIIGFESTDSVTGWDISQQKTLRRVHHTTMCRF